MGFLTGKRILITGVISDRSIAYGIAKCCHAQGAELAFTYVGDRFKDRVTQYAAQFGTSIVLPCDVADDDQIESVFKDLATQWDGLDGLVHSIGFAPREAISGELLDGLSREAFRIAHDISAYSFPAMAKAALPMMKDRQGALLTLTYLGAERVVQKLQHHGVGQG
jgi:Enoyl-[acyl-carrier-protein] reductase (NADH)